MSASPAPAQPASFWQPLQHKGYRWFWVASVVANMGIFVHSVAAGWLMTRIAPSPLFVSLIQAATALPMFLLGLPAGALADIVDRRRYLMGTQAWIAASSALLGWITVAGGAGPWGLLALTFALGAGAAMMLPAWAATVPDLVPPHELAQAVALNSVGMNCARALGPALGGGLVALAGSGPAFFLTALAFVGVFIGLSRWRSQERESILPSERFFGALRVGFRFVAQSPRLQASLVRSVTFVLFAAAPWGLLPLIVSDRLHADAHVYGLMLGAIGIGALLAAYRLPWLRARWENNALIRAATVLYGLTAAAIGFAPDPWLLAAACLAFGGIWLCVLSSIQVAAQTSSPGWVKARALAVFQVTFNGAMALGSVAWGWLANYVGLSFALAIAGGGALVAAALTGRVKLPSVDPALLRPSRHWEDPVVAAEHGDLVAEDHGPVLITVRYQVPRENTAAFLDLMKRVERSRRRGGAFSWGLFENVERPGEWTEVFLDESWVEHLRQHERVTEEDRLRAQALFALLAPGTRAGVEHLIARPELRRPVEPG